MKAMIKNAHFMFMCCCSPLLDCQNTDTFSVHTKLYIVCSYTCSILNCAVMPLIGHKGMHYAGTDAKCTITTNSRFLYWRNYTQIYGDKVRPTNRNMDIEESHTKLFLDFWSILKTSDSEQFRIFHKTESYHFHWVDLVLYLWFYIYVLINIGPRAIFTLLPKKKYTRQNYFVGIFKMYSIPHYGAL